MVVIGLESAKIDERLIVGAMRSSEFCYGIRDSLKKSENKEKEKERVIKMGDSVRSF